MTRFLFPRLPELGGGKHSAIPSLDGIRAVSILIVVISHCGLGQIVPGGFGVTIFFFLSGYLITTLMCCEYAATRGVDLKNFYIRRTIRILPPSYIVIFFALVIALIMGEHVSVKGLMANVLYMSNYYQIAGGSGGVPGMGILWSLAVEEHFYFLFPMIFLATAKLSKNRQGLVLAMLCLVVLVWRCLLVFGWNVPMSRTYLATDTRLDGILWGCVYAVLFNPALDDSHGDLLDNRKSALMGMATLIFCLVFRADWFRETFRYTLQALGLFPVFTYAVRRWNIWPVSILNSYPMRIIGLYSYSIYLTHFVILFYLERMGDMGPVVRIPLVLGASIVLSALMYHFVDLPMAQLRKRFSS